MTRLREFPARPVLAVGAIVLRGADVLLVKRGSEPNRGRWSVPGGVLESGETVEHAAAREVMEETQVAVRPIGVVDVVDYIERDDSGRVRWHYVLIDVLCRHIRGEPRASSDVDEARFLAVRDLGDYDVTPTAVRAIGSAARPPRGTA